MPQQYNSSMMAWYNKLNHIRIAEQIYKIIERTTFIMDTFVADRLKEGKNYLETSKLAVFIIFNAYPINLITKIDENAKFEVPIGATLDQFSWKLTELIKLNQEYCATKKIKLERDLFDIYALDKWTSTPKVMITTKYGCFEKRLFNVPIKICKNPYIEQVFNSSRFISKVLEMLTIDNLTEPLKLSLLRTFSAILSYQNGKLDQKSYTKLRDSFIKYENDSSLFEQFEIEASKVENLRPLQGGLSCLCYYYYDPKYMKNDEMKTETCKFIKNIITTLTGNCEIANTISQLPSLLVYPGIKYKYKYIYEDIVFMINRNININLFSPNQIELVKYLDELNFFLNNEMIPTRENLYFHYKYI